MISIKPSDGGCLLRNHVGGGFETSVSGISKQWYLLNDAHNSALYEKYKALAEKESKVIFGGRLGEYKYYDMDQVIAAALEKVEGLK